ncbi:MAG: hypothetical protein AAFS11_09630 [Planctomycetota bacterium]
MNWIRSFSAVSAVVACGWANAQGSAVLRGSDRQQMRIEQVDASGVTGTLGDARLLATWDRVRELRQETSAAQRVWLDAGEQLWRGISRLDRGDPIAAVGSLESAYEVFDAETGATGAVASDALLAARLELGNLERCIVPWLRLLEHDLSQVGPSGKRRARLDPETGLLPELPPIFVPTRTVGRTAAQIPGEGFERWTQGTNRRLAEAYASALLIAAGESPPPIRSEAPTEAVRLVEAVVEARSQSPRIRLAARQTLQDIIDSEVPAWTHAWCHAAIGLSLLRESEAERLAGVGHLLVVPSTHAERLPRLAGLCLASAAQALADMGRVEAAGTLIDELERIDPRHPALSLPSVRGLRALRMSTNGTGS